MKAQLTAAATFAIIVSGCATGGREETAPAPVGPASAQAELRDPGGRTLARATATETGDSLRVSIEAAGLAPGIYGAHVHSVGRCDPPAFESAGPHWNPSSRQHGRDNPRGQHLGDLPNLLVGTDGRGSFEFTIPGASLHGGGRRAMDADGAAVVIHARADDYRSEPSGNSGARIACGVLG
jgi:Cu-Zn family superoxide dismutase